MVASSERLKTVLSFNLYWGDCKTKKSKYGPTFGWKRQTILSVFLFFVRLAAQSQSRHRFQPQQPVGCQLRSIKTSPLQFVDRSLGDRPFSLKPDPGTSQKTPRNTPQQHFRRGRSPCPTARLFWIWFSSKISPRKASSGVKVGLNLDSVAGVRHCGGAFKGVLMSRRK